MAIGLTYTIRWVLVGDASRARLYEQRPGPTGGFKLLETFTHEESRAKVRDIVADAQGRKPVGTAGGMGQVTAPGMGVGSVYLGRPGTGPETDPKEVEAQKFARELADVLEKGLNDHAYESLVVVAPSRFLGRLRGSVAKTVRKRIEGTIEKDLTWLERPQLEARLRAMMA
jgi:protein required for attachment to host cells